MKHYRDLVETHMNAIVHDMIVQVRKGRKKELTGPQVLLKLNPWATAEQLDEMAND